MFVFNPFPVIETKNLLLRKMAHEDKHDLFQMRKDPRLHEYTDSRPDKNIEETETYIERMINEVAKNKCIIWAIQDKILKRVIGIICIWNIDWGQSTAELGYGIMHDYQGEGLMKEALLNVVDYGFCVMKLKSMDAYTEEKNTSSRKLLANCKFKAIDKVEDQGYCNYRIYRMVVYRLENTVQ